ncbi:MAG: DUF1934 domain-containing protein [Clostridia bacterium]|nr:DUF1934 domain-containing protein [Clostridia bacterium]
MALIKMNVTVSSSVTNEGDPIPERTEESYVGYMKYTRDEGVLRLSYKSEDGGTRTETLIEPFGSVIRLQRRGAIESEMLFEVGVTHASLYKIPPFSFDAEVLAKRTECSLSPFGGTLTLEYFLKIGGAEKDCLMKITATPV